MSAISYDAASSSVTFEPGMTWGEALNFLEPYGVGVAGGRARLVLCFAHRMRDLFLKKMNAQ